MGFLTHSEASEPNDHHWCTERFVIGCWPWPGQELFPPHGAPRSLCDSYRLTPQAWVRAADRTGHDRGTDLCRSFHIYAMLEPLSSVTSHLGGTFQAAAVQVSKAYEGL